jgi:hypothetical protein
MFPNWPFKIFRCTIRKPLVGFVSTLGVRRVPERRIRGSTLRRSGTDLTSVPRGQREMFGPDHTGTVLALAVLTEVVGKRLPEGREGQLRGGAVQRG